MTADARMPTDREIVLSRLIDAPQELVFDAWTDPEQVGQWWGPSGFTTTTHKMEVKPGGVWRFVMHGPDGRDYQNKITYLEVVPPERLVYRHGGDEDLEPVSFQTTVTFAAEGNKTRVTMRSVFPTAEYRDRVVAEHGLRLVVASVQDAIDDGRVAERADGSRNPLQTVPLLDGITANRFDAVFGGGRRDEGRAFLGAPRRRRADGHEGRRRRRSRDTRLAARVRVRSLGW